MDYFQEVSQLVHLPQDVINQAISEVLVDFPNEDDEARINRILNYLMDMEQANPELSQGKC